MTTLATTRLSAAQWRLVNLLYRRSAGTAGWQARLALRTVEASVDDLTELVDAYLVTARTAMSEQPMTAAAVRVCFDATHLLLSPYGLRWARGNPHNRALMALAELGGIDRWIRVLDVMAHADVDSSTVEELRDAGLLDPPARPFVGDPNRQVKLTRNGRHRLAI